MSSVKTANYALTTDYSYDEGVADRRTLPQGTFISPIEFKYVPKHVKEDPRWRFFHPETEMFCYTRWGMVPIPMKYIRER